MTDVRDGYAGNAPPSEVTDRSRERWRSRLEPGSSSSSARAFDTPPPIEQAQFVVRESGRIGFVAQFSSSRPSTSSSAATATPTMNVGVSALSFTLAPRNGALVRRIVMVDGRMPDLRGAEPPKAYVDRVGSAKELLADLGCAIHARGDLCLSSAIVLARGTYAIASHRDHAHLLYELEPKPLLASEDALAALLEHLRIARRGSILTAILALAPGRASSFEPAWLDQEGVQLVFGSRPLPVRCTGTA